MEGSDAGGPAVPVSSLLCQEDGACFGFEDGTAYDGECMEILACREASFQMQDGGGRSDVGNGDWLISARTDVVRWTLEMRRRCGFGLQAVFLSLNYLDRFLIKRKVKRGQEWAIRLLGVACLSLAAKLEETRPPKLPEFQVEGCNFDSNSITRMELLVLTTLEWRMRSVSPLPYLHYLVSRCGSKLRAQELLFDATRLILLTMRVSSTTDYRPSALATAAFFVASGRELSKKSLEYELGDALSFCGSSKADHVLSCYDAIQRTKEKLKVDESLLSSEIGNADCSFDCSIISNKRRKLAVNGHKCHNLISFSNKKG